MGAIAPPNFWKSISGDLHMGPTEDPSGGLDAYYKVRPLISFSNNLWKKAVDLITMPSIDEHVLPGLMKQPALQYLVNKPHKWGTKIFCMNDGLTG